jgi:PfaD family protein
MKHYDRQQIRPIGWWRQGDLAPQTGFDALQEALLRVNASVCLLDMAPEMGVGSGGAACIEARPADAGAGDVPLVAYVPPLHPQDLGDPRFKTVFRLHYPYVVGAMANAITSVEMVEAAAKAGMLAFFGAAGLPIHRIEAAIDQLQQRLDPLPYGLNLIHSPNEPDLEAATVNLYLSKGVRLVSASAYLDLTLPLVTYRVRGIRLNADGSVVCPNQIIAKASRVEVARRFLSPPPEKLLARLQSQGRISAEEAALAQSVPMADAVTAEADSGGHTDNQPAISLLPTFLALRDAMAARYGYQNPLFVGLGGGIATPQSAAAAFALGAAYILTGSVNQACVEAGTSETVRQMLTEAGQADVTMAPSADMFEMGVKVQVLKRGTMFPFRAARLYDLYSRFKSLEDLPAKDRAVLERDIFRRNLQEEWAHTQTFFQQRDPAQIERARSDPKHRMALVFRSYLGQSSHWANSGHADRQLDYQIWCGPAMGAFNQWVKGTFLAEAKNRRTVSVALNLLTGAAVLTRCSWLRSQKILLPPQFGSFTPLPFEQLKQLLETESAG